MRISSKELFHGEAEKYCKEILTYAKKTEEYISELADFPHKKKRVSDRIRKEKMFTNAA